MKIIILHNGVKREIDGSFDICCSRDTLHHLAKFLYGEYLRNRKSEAENSDEKFTYGWIAIPDLPPDQGGANMAPLSWKGECE